MTLTIYPAIDILGGKCVRLQQGDYSKETIYGESPLAMAHSFEKSGAQWIHLVDLDGAKAKRPVNHEEIIRTAQSLDIPVQVGGGIRTEADVNNYLNNGITRIVLGSVAIQNPEFAKKMLNQFGEKIAIGIDARDGFVATEGWLETSHVLAEDLAEEMAKYGARTFIFTDISRDGMLTGPNTEACMRIAKVANANVIASGGVGTLSDIKSLEQANLNGAIIGKALYTNRFTLEQALATVGGE
ncbi:1-(5-phosphoribosyl)-5-[(5-phosphoribosylamino)methylideneamino]imidazole-4-carboxamide isomerase [Shouchella patagoniensis]|uniref:1-(5-phosphoribosyl)-5-[(5- phosphoribosylamino)methylideneamino]imidazole-4- carboxamide isomerase n=1 Tax=Shouchella patagoniensis TaxID=228576 RepID=UPI000995BEEA|nr:1-(5-phosphoribosyl)-5-[(5-phosphoribosylamino)methylideneamino]imidazole-4-carboxamide isomerase [Shouchella patagoniensis]